MSTIQKIKDKLVMDLGQLKYQKVYGKVIDSSKVAQMMQESKARHIAPTAMDILSRLKTMPYFILSRMETSALGAIIVFELWDQNINTTQSLLNEDGKRDVINNILILTSLSSKYKV